VWQLESSEKDRPSAQDTLDAVQQQVGTTPVAICSSRGAAQAPEPKDEGRMPNVGQAQDEEGKGQDEDEFTADALQFVELDLFHV